MLRAAVEAGTLLGKLAKSIMDSGKLVPDDVIIQLVRERVGQPDCKNGFLFDGFPRTIPQAESIEIANIAIDHVIEIYVPDEEIIKRMSGRLVHPGSGRVYHLINHPPKVPGIDDVTGEPLIQREDDSEATVRKRLEVYHQQTEPLIAFYQKLIPLKHGKLHFHRVSGLGTVEEVRDQIFGVLK